MNFDISISQILSHLAHLLAAYAFAFPIGWDREAAARSAGLRTFPLVAIGSCAYMLTAQDVLPSGDSYARVMYGLITGIGFIGGGAILKDRGRGNELHHPSVHSSAQGSRALGGS